MLSSLLTSIFTGEAALAVKRTRAAIIAYALIGVLVLLALGFLLAAAFIYLSRIYGTLETALGFGGGFLLLALFIWAGFKIGSRARAKRRARRHRGELTSLATAAAVAALPALVKGRSAASLVGLPLAALIATQIYRENSGGRRAPRDEDDDLPDV